MNTLEQLVKEARERRDSTISQAREHYQQTVCGIKLASRKNRVIVTRGKKRRPRYNTKINHDGNFSSMSTRAAAEAVLRELGPLNLAELTVEVQRRGCRACDDPRVVAHAINNALLYHRDRFRRDGEGRWFLLS